MANRFLPFATFPTHEDCHMYSHLVEIFVEFPIIKAISFRETFLLSLIYLTSRHVWHHFVWGIISSFVWGWHHFLGRYVIFCRVPVLRYFSAISCRTVSYGCLTFSSLVHSLKSSSVHHLLILHTSVTLFYFLTPRWNQAESKVLHP